MQIRTDVITQLQVTVCSSVPLLIPGLTLFKTWEHELCIKSKIKSYNGFKRQANIQYFVLYFFPSSFQHALLTISEHPALSFQEQAQYFISDWSVHTLHNLLCFNYMSFPLLPCKVLQFSRISFIFAVLSNIA